MNLNIQRLQIIFRKSWETEIQQLIQNHYNIRSMSFYRSQTVKHYKLILPRSNAEQIMHHIGTKNLIHIQPIHNPILDRPYIRQVKRCSDCLMRMQQIQTILQQKNIFVQRQEFNNRQYELFFQEWNKLSEGGRLSLLHVLDNIDVQIEKIWDSYKESSHRLEEIKGKVQFTRQNLAILKAGSQQFGDSFFMEGNRKFEDIAIQLRDIISPKINIKAGVIRIRDQMHLKRTCFRISKNNCFPVFIPYSSVFEKVSPDEKDKMVFFFLYSGVKGGTLDKKLDKIVGNFSNVNYIIPNSLPQLTKQKSLLQQQLSQHQNLLKLNQTQFINYLAQICQLIPNKSFSRFEVYKLYLMKQKQIYNQMNQMHVYNNFLEASIYVRQKDIITLHQCLKQIQMKSKLPSGQLLESKDEENPPTLYTRNAFTATAQQIVQTYGVPSYKQANPSFFTVITFPFLFGVMFGDIAHGSILICFGISLIFFRNHLPYQFLKMFIPHRYMILLMGFFATYCGFIYNDFMAVSLNIFGSCYNVANSQPGVPVPKIDNQCVYPLGLDPVWSISTNNINFVDSLKMKISVIIGVLHMILGIFVKATNSIFFKRKLDFFFQFIPQLAFMVCLFGYMDFLIIYKWLQPWKPLDPNAPSIITTMINVPLKFGKTQSCCGGQPMWGSPGDTSQNSIQLGLLIIAIICIPLMLLPKPLIKIYRRKQKVDESQDAEGKLFIQFSELNEQRQLAKQTTNEKSSNQHENASQIFVHQLIETIQYVLGSISNTASYLRLWALSLAHSQLSEVFFQKTVEGGIAKGFPGLPIMIFTYPILAGVTLAVLLCMDTMECFLHTLRLHWVEFQNKFYKGNGYSFITYNFKRKIVEQLKNS